MVYEVEIIETRAKVIKVQADSADKAKEIANSVYEEGQEVLDLDNVINVEYITLKK